MNTLKLSASSTLSVGWYFFHEGTVYQITHVNVARGMLQAAEHITGCLLEFSYQELVKSTKDENFLCERTLEALQAELHHRQPLLMLTETGLPEIFQARAKHIIQVVEQTQNEVAFIEAAGWRQGQHSTQTSVLKQALQRLPEPINLSTYYRYRKIYTEHAGNSARIAASLRRSNFNKVCMSPAQLHFMDTFIQEYAVRPNPQRKAQLYRLAVSVLKHTQGWWIDPAKCLKPLPSALVANLLNPELPIQAVLENPDNQAILVPIQLPSQRWFYNYIKYFQAVSQTQEFASRTEEAPHNLFDTFVSNASAPLQYVFADHWHIDVLSLGEDGQVVRLWLTLLLDAYSRCVLGMALLPEAPCIESIQQALLHAIWPKTIPEQWGLQAEWIGYGIPQHLSLDNAWAHHSHSLEDLVRSLGMNGRYTHTTLVFRPPYRGRYGAIIERLFGNFSDQMKQFLPGAIRSEKGQIRASALKNACLRYEDLNRFLHELVLRYQHTPHRGLNGMTPHEKWLEGMQFGLPLIPQLSASVERLFWRMDPRSRTITSQGIAAFGMHYTGLTLHDALRIDVQGRKVHYHIRYSPADISRLALFRDGHWVGDVYATALRLPDGSTRSLSLAERDIAQKLARRVGQGVGDWLQFTHSWQQLAEIRQNQKRKEERAAKSASRSTSSVNSSHELPFDSSAEDVQNLNEHYTALVRGFSRN